MIYKSGIIYLLNLPRFGPLICIGYRCITVNTEDLMQ